MNTHTTLVQHPRPALLVESGRKPVPAAPQIHRHLPHGMGVSQSVLGVGALEKHVPPKQHRPPAHSKVDRFHEADNELHDLIHQAQLGIDSIEDGHDPVQQFLASAGQPPALIGEADGAFMSFSSISSKTP